MPGPDTLTISRLDAAAFAPYGWMLGKPMASGGAAPTFSNQAIDFWQEHLFDAGAGGEPEVLWVVYRNRDPIVASLEMHRLTQQAIVPLTGAIVHIVASSGPDGGPDRATLAAFQVAPGTGLCMRPGCWHATRVAQGEVTCLMLTRHSTTRDLVGHLTAAAPARESAIATLDSFRLAGFRL